MYDFKDEASLASRREFLENHCLSLSDEEAIALLASYADSNVPSSLKVQRDSLIAYLPGAKVSEGFSIAAAQLGLEIKLCEQITCSDEVIESFKKRLGVLVEGQFRALIRNKNAAHISVDQFKVGEFLFEASMVLVDPNLVRKTMRAAIRSCDSHEQRQKLLERIADKFPDEINIGEEILNTICDATTPRDDRLDLIERIFPLVDKSLYTDLIISNRNGLLPHQYFNAEILRYLDLIADNFELRHVDFVPELKTIFSHISFGERKPIDDFDEEDLGRFHLDDLANWTDNAALMDIECRIEDRMRMLLLKEFEDLDQLPIFER